jgi:amino acid transporter
MLGNARNTDASAAAGPAPPDLKRGKIGTLSLLGQSVAGVGPSIGAAAFFTLAFADAGNATWISVVLAVVGVLAVGVCISYLARHHVSPGALYAFIPRGLKSGGVGILGAGIALTLGACATIGALFGFGLYAANFLSDAGIANLSPGQIAYLDLVFLVIAGLLAVLDIRISTRTLLVIEVLSMAAISSLLIVVLARHPGGAFNSAVATGRGSSIHGIVLGAVFFILGFGGFESAAALGAEARRPRRSVPLAVLGSALVVALFFVVNAYVQVLGFTGTGQSLAAQAFPLTALAKLYHVEWLGTLVALGVAISFFSALNAFINYTARMAYAIARDRLLPRHLGRAHSRTGAPHVAVAALTGIAVIALVTFTVAHADQATVFGDVSTIAGYCFTLLYLLVSLAAIGWALQQLTRPAAVIVAGVIGTAAMAVEFYYSFVPFPAYPASLPLIIFIGIVGGLLTIYIILRITSAEVAARALRGTTLIKGDDVGRHDRGCS